MISPQNQIQPQKNESPENDTKVAPMGDGENECPSECSCEEQSSEGVHKGVTDTVWKAGCYKINPTTQSGNSSNSIDKVLDEV